MSASEVRELPTMTSLRSWARRHHTEVRYLGPTLESRPVYAAEDGPVARVACDRGPDPYPHPLEWHSPLERLTPQRTP